MKQENALSRLEWSVRALAQPASEQRALFPSFVSVADELALELEESLNLLGDAAVELSTDRAAAVENLDAKLAEMSGPSNEMFWTDEALDSAAEWSSVRSNAKEVIRLFGWSEDAPSASGQTYVTEGGAVRKSDAD